MSGKHLSNTFSNEINNVYFELTKENEDKFIKEAKQGNVSARNKLLNSQLKQITRIARSYACYNNPIEDLVSEAVLGFEHAINKFDENAGIRFVTYYMYWVRDYVNRYVLQNRTVRTPLSVSKMTQKDIDIELAKGNHVSKLADTFSIDTPTSSSEGNCSFLDTMSTNECIETSTHNSIMCDSILNSVELDKTEKLMFEYYHIEQMKVREIGELFNISKQAVSIKIKKVEKKLKSHALKAEFA